MERDKLYPEVPTEFLESRVSLLAIGGERTNQEPLSNSVSGETRRSCEDIFYTGKIGFPNHQKGQPLDFDAQIPRDNGEKDHGQSDSNDSHQKGLTFDCDVQIPMDSGEKDHGQSDSNAGHQKGLTFDCDVQIPMDSVEKDRGQSDSNASHRKGLPFDCDAQIPRDNGEKDRGQSDSGASHKKQGKYFYYDSPLSEETGIWIPVSVPPMSESAHEEWARGFGSNGGYFPEGEVDWNQFIGEDKEMTMWDIVVEMLLAARGKVTALASTDIHGRIAWMSSHLLEQAWGEMAQTLSEANFGNAKEILESEPPKWLFDSAASACMLCSVRFHPIMCPRHHCRFCGGLFCNDCSKGRSLMPVKFRMSDPQRVCDVCCVRLESVQPYLMDQVSRAAQSPTHDLTDLSTLRSWVNFPWGQTMEYEIYKATNTIRGYNKVGALKPERAIPDSILRQAKGLAILTVVKVGMMVTYNIGTGLVVARREDGSWSPPSAIASFGVGWGAQVGGELTDFIIILRTEEAVRTFGSNMHLSVGAGLSAAVGIVGRAAEADLRAGDGGYAACYTYSCSKGAFVGCSLEGSIVSTRTLENSRFYGSSTINSSDILLGSLPKPPAAAILYHALADLYRKFEG